MVSFGWSCQIGARVQYGHLWLCRLQNLCRSNGTPLLTKTCFIKNILLLHCNKSATFISLAYRCPMLNHLCSGTWTFLLCMSCYTDQKLQLPTYQNRHPMTLEHGNHWVSIHSQRIKSLLQVFAVLTLGHHFCICTQKNKGAETAPF